jgi:hypothetical protein
MYMECTWSNWWGAKDKVKRQVELRYMKERRYEYLVNGDKGKHVCDDE